MRVCPCSKMKYQLLNCLVLSRLHSAQTCTILPVLPGSCIIHPSLHLTIIAACFTWTLLPLTTVLIIFHMLTSKPKSHSYISCSVLSQFAKSAFLPQSALMGNLPFFTPSHWGFLKFLKCLVHLYSWSFFSCFAVPPTSSSLSYVSSLISTKQIYSFNFPRSMHCFQVCTTSGGAGTHGLGSRVPLINSHPLLGMTNFPGAVTKNYDAALFPPQAAVTRWPITRLQV